jgi:hypothetical protein
MNKICSCCKVEKTFDAFNKKSSSKDGLQAKCRECGVLYRKDNKAKIAEQRKDYKESNKSKIDEQRREYREVNKVKITTQQKEYEQINKDRIHTYQKLYRENNKDKLSVKGKDYYEDNKIKVIKRQKNYREENKDKLAAKSAKRRASKIQATPIWLTSENFAQIEELYTIAQMFKLYTGQEYHVDHIVPLRGHKVCGLHVPWNLQVLPAKENMVKSNKLGEYYV